MIKGRCITNLDNTYSDVKVFASVPLKGDRVSAYKSGHGDIHGGLKVCSIQHTIKMNDNTREYEPFIIVELNN